MIDRMRGQIQRQVRGQMRDQMRAMMGDKASPADPGGCDCNCPCCGQKAESGNWATIEAPGGASHTMQLFSRPTADGMTESKGYFQVNAPSAIQTWTSCEANDNKGEKRVFLFNTAENGHGQPMRLELQIDGEHGFSFGSDDEACEEACEVEEAIECCDEQETGELEGVTAFAPGESDDFDVQIEALVSDLTGNQPQVVEVHAGKPFVVKSHEVTASELAPIGATIQVETEEAHGNIDAEIEELIRSLESQGEVHVETHVVHSDVAQPPHESQARIEELESEVQELRGLVESLVKELNKR